MNDHQVGAKVLLSARRGAGRSLPGRPRESKMAMVSNTFDQDEVFGRRRPKRRGVSLLKAR